jgi:hypothetical protein
MAAPDKPEAVQFHPLSSDQMRARRPTQLTTRGIGKAAPRSRAQAKDQRRNSRHYRQHD